MGCSQCKKKKQSGSETQNVEYTEINDKSGKKVGIENVTDSVTGQLDGQTFSIKLATFIVLVLGFPIIYVGIMVMVFMQFFRNGKGELINPLQSLIHWTVTKYAMFKYRKENRRREKEFEKNRSYEGDSELLDIEVFQTEENNIEDEK